MRSGRRLRLFLAATALVVVACAQSAIVPSAPPATSGPSASSGAIASPRTRPSAPPPSADNPLPVVVDTDLAGDDLLALLVLLRDPAVDVREVTIAATGEVHCAPGIRNARRLLAALGRPEVPVACGRENPGPNGRWFPPDWRTGADAFYGVELPAVDGESQRGETAPQLLVRLAAASEEPLTLVALGPMSNVADAASLDPSFAGRLAGIHAMAGTIDAPGNVDDGTTTPADGVEWNVGADPDAMAAVLALDVPLTLVGLDATDDVPVPGDIVEQLAADHAAAGADIAYEMYVRTPFLAAAGNDYWDPLAAVTLTDPAVATWQDLTIRMEPTGPTAGRLARDPGGRPVRVAMAADRSAFLGRFLAALRTGGPRAHPFDVSGSLAVRWDGTHCRIMGDPPTHAGVVRAQLENASGAPVSLLLAGATPPRTWDDVASFVRSADLSNPNLVVPDWLVQVQVDLSAGAGSTASAYVTLPAGNLGALCATGDWPKLDLVDAGGFSVAG